MSAPDAFAQTPKPPYYAAIFTSLRTANDHGYGQMAERMMQLAATQPGFLGVESVRGASGFGITVSYWESEEAIGAWKANLEHQSAQQGGRRVWYAEYQLRIAKVERAYGQASRPVEELKIKVDDLQGAEIAALLTEHLRSLKAVSDPCSMHALDLEKLRAPEITFWSAWRGAQLAGCGALKQLDARHGEIKSMRTVSGQLRRGVASKVLAHIIAEAKARGYQRLSLETGANEHFTAAHHLYRKFGFIECGPFGSYRPDPKSLFMTREI